ncbi:diguanylate cyclase [Oxalobacteraceae bacterium OM1]|nr:diguanylate cyclase [Oxalobacteraceae bacterium OM1]
METAELSRYELFYTLFESSLEPMLLTRPDGRCFRANHAAERLLGYTAEEFSQCHRSDFVDMSDPGTIALLRERTEKGFATGVTRFRRRDGSWFDAELSSFLFPGGDGKPWAAITVRDITEQIRLQRALDEANRFYLTVVEALFEGVFLFDGTGRIYGCNRSAERLLGVSREALIGRRAGDHDWGTVRKDGTPYPPDQHPATMALATGKPVRNVEFGFRRPDGELVWLRVNANPLFREGMDRPYAVVTSFEDITERTRQELDLWKLSLTDALTGVPNRRAFMDRVQQLFDLARRTGIAVSALMLDVDDFKDINDSYGHAAGDDALKGVAAAIGGALRSTDYVARLGGDEFCVLLPATDAAGALEMAQRLKDAVRGNTVYAAHEALTLSVSIGHAVLEHGDADVRAWLARADRDLYADKQPRRRGLPVDAWCVAHPAGRHP